MFKASGGFYNIRAFQRTLNQGHVMRRKKRTQWKRSPSKVWRFYGISYFQSIFELSWISLHHCVFKQSDFGILKLGHIGNVISCRRLSKVMNSGQKICTCIRRRFEPSGCKNKKFWHNFKSQPRGNPGSTRGQPGLWYLYFDGDICWNL